MMLMLLGGGRQAIIIRKADSSLEAAPASLRLDDKTHDETASEQLCALLQQIVS